MNKLTEEEAKELRKVAGENYMERVQDIICIGNTLRDMSGLHDAGDDGSDWDSEELGFTKEELEQFDSEAVAKFLINGLPPELFEELTNIEMGLKPESLTYDQLINMHLLRVKFDNWYLANMSKGHTPEGHRKYPPWLIAKYGVGREFTEDDQRDWTQADWDDYEKGRNDITTQGLKIYVPDGFSPVRVEFGREE